MAYYGRRRYGGGYRRRTSYRRRRSSRYGRTPRVVVNMPRPAKRRRRRVAKKKAPMTRFQVAQMNPFHPDAVGAKLPDANSMPSCAVQIQDNVPISTDGTNGTGTIAFRPYPTGVRTAAASAGASSWAWAPAFGSVANSVRQPSVVANFSLVRPVAHGIRLTSNLSPNTVTGEVHVAVYASDLYGKTTWDFPANTTEMSNLTVYKRFPLALLSTKSITIVNRTMDFSSEKYVDPANDVAETAGDLTFNTTGWGTIIVSVTGAPVSSSVVQVESLIHLEAIPLKTSVADASPAARYNPATIMRVSEYVDRADPVVVSTSNENDVIRERSTFLGGVADYVSETVSSVAYPAGRAAGRWAVNAGASYVMNQFGGTAGFNQGNPALMNG